MAACLLLSGARLAWPEALDEFRTKRELVFEFEDKPSISRQGRDTLIAFTTRGYCDATVAIEDAQGRIVRHLASGVLGERAPEPFQKGSKSQRLLWDGKDDQGEYLEDREALTVRVSLGLKPQFERTLLWSPHKQRSALPLLAASPDGVYVYDARGVDHLRLFDHDGNYVRTVYPFPANRLKGVDGLRWHEFPQGYTRPLKESNYQQTLLTSGDNDSIQNRIGMTGRAATGLAVRNKRIALMYEHLNRLAADGTSGGLPLKGPPAGFEIQKHGYGDYGRGKQTIGPTSVAFSPDGKTLYLTGYLAEIGVGRQPENLFSVGVDEIKLAGIAAAHDAAGNPVPPGSGSVGGTDDRHAFWIEEKGKVLVCCHVRCSSPNSWVRPHRTARPPRIHIF